jgi:serine/threonine-protein kinase
MSQPSDAPRDLLFGLLALQSGLIDQGALVAAFLAWTQAKGRPTADLLVERGALDAPRRAILDALVEQHLAMHGGDAEKSLAAIDPGRSTRESLARIGDHDLNATLGHVGAMVTEHGPGSAAGDADRTRTFAAGAAPSDGQRFRLLRPHARGGLGAVFVALDAELNREVALKQILDGHADDPKSRTRFLLEAEITGGLEHPGIVPVYSLGTNRDGRPFYAMRFIRGDSLKEAIEQFHADETLKHDPSRRSLVLRNLLRRFLDVCNAIEYAHSRGVLHRDIKPVNVIVGRHGETLVVDWGLAKPVGRDEPDDPAAERALRPQSASGSAETLPGMALGTPAFMSPEQAAGAVERLGPSSDVYSLGATLYCLLTGSAPFEGDVADVLRAVQNGVFARPRKLDAMIDPALEAICLKAMALRHNDRYPSPRALAEDVERWIADEPVTAYREPSMARARRWARRNRTVVAMSAVAAVLAAAGLATVALIQTRANRELQEALGREMAARQAETAALEIANKRFETARLAVESFYTGASEDAILKQPQLRSLRERLLRTALGFYETMLADLKEHGSQGPATSPLAVMELGKAAERVGQIQDQVGARGEALDAFLRADAIYRSAAPATVPASTHAQLWLAISRLQRRMGRPAEGLRSVEKALSILGEPDPTREISMLYYNFALLNKGGALLDLGRPDEAARTIESCLPFFEEKARRSRNIANSWGDLASTYQHLGYAYHESGRPEEALRVHRKELEGQTNYKSIGTSNEGDPQARLAQCHIDVGLDQTDLGRLDDAKVELGLGRTILEELTGTRPSDADVASELARAEYGLARVAARGGDAEALGRHAARALELVQSLESPSPGDRYRRAVLLGLRAASVTPPDRDKLAAEAIAALKEAVSGGFLKAHLLDRDPDLQLLRDRPDFQAVRQQIKEAFKDALSR